MKTEEKSEFMEVKELLTKMNSRIEILDKEKEQNHSQFFRTYRGSYRGQGRGNRDRGENHQRGTGRGSYQPTRPYGRETFKPKTDRTNPREGNFDQSQKQCYKCGKFGHIDRNCKEN